MAYRCQRWIASIPFRWRALEAHSGRDAVEPDPGHFIGAARDDVGVRWRTAALLEVGPARPPGSLWLVGVDVESDDAGKHPEGGIVAGVARGPIRRTGLVSGRGRQPPVKPFTSSAFSPRCTGRTGHPAARQDGADPGVAVEQGGHCRVDRPHRSLHNNGVGGNRWLLSGTRRGDPRPRPTRPPSCMMCLASSASRVFVRPPASLWGRSLSGGSAGTCGGHAGFFRAWADFIASRAK